LTSPSKTRSRYFLI